MAVFQQNFINEEQMADQIWPMGYSSPAPVLRTIFLKIISCVWKYWVGKENLWCLDFSVYFLVKMTLFLLALETWTLLLSLDLLSEAIVPTEQMSPFVSLGG